MTDTLDPVALLPCPFCGGDAEIVENTFPPPKSKRDKWFHPSCTTDGCPGFVPVQDEQGGSNCDFRTREEAAAIWNRRALPTARKELVERLNEIIKTAPCYTGIRGPTLDTLREAASALRAGNGFVMVPREQEDDLCEDCPPVGYPTDKTRCLPCPRRAAPQEE